MWKEMGTSQRGYFPIICFINQKNNLKTILKLLVMPKLCLNLKIINFEIPVKGYHV